MADPTRALIGLLGQDGRTAGADLLDYAAEARAADRASALDGIDRTDSAITDADIASLFDHPQGKPALQSPQSLQVRSPASGSKVGETTLSLAFPFRRSETAANTRFSRDTMVFSSEPVSSPDQPTLAAVPAASSSLHDRGQDVALHAAASPIDVFGSDGLLEMATPLQLDARTGRLPPVKASSASDRVELLTNLTVSPEQKSAEQAATGEQDRKSSGRHERDAVTRRRQQNAAWKPGEQDSAPVRAHTWSAVPPARAAAQSGPIEVIVVNGHALTDGMTDHLARQLDRPPIGITGPDSRLSPWSLIV